LGITLASPSHLPLATDFGELSFFLAMASRTMQPSPDTERHMQMTDHKFQTWDGCELHYHAWLPEEKPTRAVLLFHRGHEHSARWDETVQQLASSGTAFFACDQRGHGLSPGERGFAPSVTGLAKDADAFARHITQTHGIPMQEMAVIAASVGAVVATAWVHDFGPPIRGMVLAAPAFRVKLYIPFAIPLLRVLHKVRPNSVVKSYVKSKLITHDPQQAAMYDADPLIFRQISVAMLLDLHNTAKRLVQDAGAIRVPTLILSADKDWVVSLPVQRQFFQRLGSPMKQMEAFRNCYHSLFHETDRQTIVKRAGEFLDECFHRPNEDGCVAMDRGGYTRTEYDLLRMPGSSRWSIARANLKSFGKLSDGVRLGWKNGFDSGLSLDYVYRNKPRGITPLGKVIDYFYLNSIGWRGIRVRRENLQRILSRTIESLARNCQRIHILDIASGPGRYVLETLDRMRNVHASAMLCDYQQANLDAASARMRELNLPDVTITQGDAFDRRALATRTPKPTIAIVSGLYELFPDNAQIMESLRGIADAMEPGGKLIYTCQPWHPQVEFIARVLTNRESKPWIMRRRTQAEMDGLVRLAGFEKEEQDIDPWGIFTVCVATRVAS
jgi:alpha-beta hydrolase superfamily lysophospholipase/SAM-dependent methyltransferase